MRAFGNHITHMRERYSHNSKMRSFLAQGTLPEEFPCMSHAEAVTLLEQEYPQYGSVRESICIEHKAEKAPILLMLDTSDVDRRAYDLSLFLHMNGIEQEDRVLQALSIEEGNSLGISTMKALESLHTNTLRLSVKPTQKSIALAKQFSANAFIGTTQTLHAYAQHLPMKKLRTIVLHDIFAPLKWRKEYEQLHGDSAIEIIHFPLCSTFIAQCPEKTGFHIHPELGYFEIVSPEGALLPEGETGEIVITPFGIQGFPLLRCKTGVHGAITTTPCACGRTSPRLQISPSAIWQREVAVTETVTPSEECQSTHPRSPLVDYLKKDERITNFLVLLDPTSKTNPIQVHAVTKAANVGSIMQGLRKEFGEYIPVLTTNQPTLENVQQKLHQAGDHIYEGKL
ncbi:hypothetical protein CALK_1533 [Chitinivibrio alkaliphilus ACht1]|uniref:Phenylacetate-coenzyme A ligase n=2 Tax=Chitinivibrio TaxID=1505231 RepID=U7D4P8_9BACT|nr:hypothetical protein CALK_1533 [Chitinivibrio alkaliphilus ACht1]